MQLGRAIVVGCVLGSAGACGGGGSHAGSGSSAPVSSGNGTSAVDAGAAVLGSAQTPTSSANPDGGITLAVVAAPSGPQAAAAQQALQEGGAAFARGDFPTAARAFHRAYDIYPAPEIAYNLATADERMGEADEAIRFFERVRTSTPPPSPDLLARIDRRESALRAFLQRQHDGIAQTMPAADALSQEGNTWFQRGVTLYRGRHFNQALLAFEQAYQYLQTPELFFNLAVTHEQLHDYDRALEFMREYLDARRGTPEEAYIQQRIHALEARRQ